MILGIDEVGRGPWAGPLVVGAVVLGGASIDGLTDSKKITKKRREQLDVLIRERADGYGIGWVAAEEIDKIGLAASLKLATIRAVEQVRAPYHEIIIDGTINFLKDTTKGRYVTTMKKADLLVPSVSAASIIAKVARDTFMTEQDTVYPGYGFASHVGYGTAAHSAAIASLGLTPLHRLSFAPVKEYRLKNARLTSKSIGDRAEDVAANELVRDGHTILDRNWKTKYCEIDIVSSLGSVLYFTEVKYRKTSNQGGAIGAITSKKHNQMKFAAEYYALKNKYAGYDLRLAVSSVEGENMQNVSWMDLD